MSSATNPKIATARALLAKAEDPATPEAEAELARKRAFEIMAKYGIEQAMVADGESSADAPADRQVVLDNPWAMERVRLMNRIAIPLGCNLIHLGRDERGRGRRVHVFGYESDLERAEMLYASLFLQMINGLGARRVPAGVSPRAWRRSWLLGFIDRVGRRIEEAEAAARDDAHAETSAIGRGVAVVLADRKAIVDRQFRAAYPHVRKGGSTTMRGTGFGDGWAAGGRADIGGRRIGRASAGAIMS